MPRLISFSKTTAQIRDRSKTVTRRAGWLWLVEQAPTPEHPIRLTGVEKGMGLKKGEKVVRLTDILVTSATREPLSRMLDEPAYGDAEARREGFPEWTGAAFVEFYCREMRVRPDQAVTRIEFTYPTRNLPYSG